MTTKPTAARCAGLEQKLRAELRLTAGLIERTLDRSSGKRAAGGRRPGMEAVMLFALLSWCSSRCW